MSKCRHVGSIVLLHTVDLSISGAGHGVVVGRVTVVLACIGLGEQSLALRSGVRHGSHMMTFSESADILKSFLSFGAVVCTQIAALNLDEDG